MTYRFITDSGNVIHNIDHYSIEHVRNLARDIAVLHGTSISIQEQTWSNVDTIEPRYIIDTSNSSWQNHRI